MSDNYLTLAEVSQLLKVHRRTVGRWIAAGKLQALRIPGRGGHEWRIKESDLQAFLNGRQEADDEVD